MELQVKQISQISSGAFSLIFVKPQDFTYYAGQYITLQLPIETHDGRSNSRPFTLASSPSEDFLMITTRYGVSDFKKALAKLGPQDTVVISYPAGTFTLQESDPAVMIAGGIGITPFRSMIKQAIDQHLTTSITLIYSNPDENMVFQEELDNWQKIYPGLHVIYINTKSAGRLDKQKLQTLLPPTVYNPQPIFYLSGPPLMVTGLKNTLMEMGVDETNIRTDRFSGYQ